jgi:hypothetical protein
MDEDEVSLTPAADVDAGVAVDVGGLSAAQALADVRARQRAFDKATTSNQDLFQAAMGRLQAQRVGPSSAEQLFAIAAALQKPTRTGSFFEAFGNVGGAMSEAEKAKREAVTARDAMLEKYGLAQSSASLEALKAQLGGSQKMFQAAMAAEGAQEKADRAANMPTSTVRTIQYALTLPENDPERKLILASIAGTPENIAAAVSRASGIQGTKPPPKAGKARYRRGADGSIYVSRD